MNPKMETEQIPGDLRYKKGRHRKKQLYNSILQQMEFYFSDSNLTKDRFLSQLIESDPNIEISVFLKFNKLSKLTTNIEDITKAISKSKLIELSEDKTKVRRKLPVKVKQDVDECTIYVERLKSDATHDWLKSIFSEFGNVVYVSIPRYKHSGIIKGFAFVEFENAEEANVAMQYFESINCKIPSDIEPQKLCSIASYDPNEKNENRIHVKCVELEAEMYEQINENEQKHSIMVEEITKEDKQEMEKTNEFNETGKTKKQNENQTKDTEKKKRKHSNTKPDEGKLQEASEDEIRKKQFKIEEKSETIEDVQEQTPPQKKRKHSETETNENVAQQVSGGEKKKLKIQHKAETNESVQQEMMSDGEGEEKKRKKHKKSNRKKVNLKEIGIQILSKKDWKRMRNRYLEMQRKTMKQLKMHLNRQRFGNRYTNKKYTGEQNSEMEVVKENYTPKESDTAKQEPQSLFVPGTIVKVSLLEPCENNKKLKAEFQDCSPEIKYVDIPSKFGSEEVFIRFSDNENAQTFCASKFSKGKSYMILEGHEEKKYWEKIEANRQEKQKKMVGKQRGRDKLLKKAERQAAKHVRFDDNDSE